MAEGQREPRLPDEAREALLSWGPLVGALLLVGALGLAFFFGLVGERTVAVVAAAAFALMLAGIGVHAGFERRDARLRGAAVLFGLGLLVVTGLPASSVLLPGRPEASAVLGSSGEGFALPAAGAWRLVVAARLARKGESKVEYRLRVGDEELEGRLERVRAAGRGRRGPAIPVEEEHDVQAHEVRVAAAGARVRLESLEGKPAGAGLTVQAYRTVAPGLLWALIAGLLAAGAFLEGRFPARGGFAMPAVAAALFGLIVLSAPRAALGPVLGAALLGAGGGVVGGTLLRVIGTALFGRPAVERRRAGVSGEPAGG